MVKPAHRRSEKYKKNIDPDQTKRKLERLRGVMIDLETPYLAQIAEIERKVKRICEAQGVQTFEVAQYCNYAREVYSKCKRFESLTLAAEVQYLVNKWVSRGLIGSLLIRIAGLFGVTPTAPVYARDVSNWLARRAVSDRYDWWHWILGQTYRVSGTLRWVTPTDLWATPFYISRRCKLTGWGINITFASAVVGGKCSVALYHADDELYPTTLLTELSEIAIDAIGFQTIVIDETLEPNVYAVALRSGVADNFQMYSVGYHQHLLGLDTVIPARSYSGWWLNQAWMSAAYPNFDDVFPSKTVITPNRSDYSPLHAYKLDSWV